MSDWLKEYQEDLQRRYEERHKQSLKLSLNTKFDIEYSISILRDVQKNIKKYSSETHYCYEGISHIINYLKEQKLPQRMNYAKYNTKPKKIAYTNGYKAGYQAGRKSVKGSDEE